MARNLVVLPSRRGMLHSLIDLLDSEEQANLLPIIMRQAGQQISPTRLARILVEATDEYMRRYWLSGAFLIERKPWLVPEIIARLVHDNSLAATSVAAYNELLAERRREGSPSRRKRRAREEQLKRRVAKQAQRSRQRGAQIPKNQKRGRGDAR